MTLTSLLHSNIILSTLFFLFTNAVHQPDLSSTMLVEREDGTWVLQIRAALNAFEYEIHFHYGKDSYTTPEEFNALVIRHLMDNISITCNGAETVYLQKGNVKLGHETNAFFELQGIPKKLKKIGISNTSFKDIQDNQSALIILKKGFKKHQFKLNERNKHTAQLKAIKNQFELQ